MRKVYLLFLLLCIPTVLADSWPYTSESVDLTLKISSHLDLVPKSNAATIKDLTINLTLVPVEYRQQHITSKTSSPQAVLYPTYALFSWADPDAGTLEFSLDSDITLSGEPIRISKKIKFPFEAPPEVEKFTQPSTTIDSDNPAIFALANNLAEGEDDLNIVVFKLAQWTKNNIKYDLSTLTAEVTQKSSWVLQTRQGVCDELTNLFIALNRALGIPAKFVSGVAYTESKLFSENWGAHGWAEVYFPGYGWIPYDVTYGQFAYIDPTHIKLKEGMDAEEASTRYQWLGKDMDILTYPLKFDVLVKEYSGTLPKNQEVIVEPIKTKIAFGSYNLIEAIVRNLQPYYVADELYLSKPPELSIIGEERQQVMLKPHEDKKIFWIVKVDDNLQKNYLYTFPVVIYSADNSSTIASFTSSQKDYFYTLSEIQALQDAREDKEEPTAATNVAMVCEVSPSSLYQNEQAVITCSMRNSGNSLLKDIDVCIEKDCQKATLGIGQQSELAFEFTPIKIGEQDLLAEVYGEEKLASQFIRVDVSDLPTIVISNVSLPDSVEFDDEYTLSFILRKESVSSPNDVTITIDEEGLTKTWTLDQLNTDKSFEITLQGRDLSIGINQLSIKAAYFDENNRPYAVEQIQTITLNKVSAGQRIQIFFNDILKAILRFFR
ncbi:MAG TPA: transglutaminase domain-containing protein [Candidatus Nanoarchaeia archaeon]|nr:transglutaminase domain-containing protein [Candidatus Nanoarchaeia archaeon]